MKSEMIQAICTAMKHHLSHEQNMLLEDTLHKVFKDFCIPNLAEELTRDDQEENTKILNLFIAAKKIEGCSDNTIKYYTNTLVQMMNAIQKNIRDIDTNDLRFYLSNYQQVRNSSKTTMDNIRRIMSSFFSWLEDEHYILKSPVRRIHSTFYLYQDT